MKEKCNNLICRTDMSRAYCGLESLTGEAGESVMITFILLGQRGVSL